MERFRDRGRMLKAVLMRAVRRTRMMNRQKKKQKNSKYLRVGNLRFLSMATASSG
jgi:hypothetical protein